MPGDYYTFSANLHLVSYVIRIHVTYFHIVWFVSNSNIIQLDEFCFEELKCKFEFNDKLKSVTK